MSFKGQQIKRYKNRKLYSVTESKYVTHKDIAEYFKRGYGVIVQDCANKNEDITVKTLVTALVSDGHFDLQVETANLSNIESNLQERGVTIHG